MKIKIQSDRGFTLIELIVVLTLMIVVLGISGIHFGNTLSSVRLGGVSREVSAFIRMARLTAMNKGEAHSVIIDLDHGCYGMEGGPSRPIPDGIIMRISDPVRGEQTKGVYRITAHAMGSIEAGEIILRSANKMVRIEMDPVVGSVLIKSGENRS